MKAGKNEYYTEIKGEIRLVELLPNGMIQWDELSSNRNRGIRMKCELFKTKKEAEKYFKSLSGVKKHDKTGAFGIIYEQFKNQPVEAIKHLMKVKQGECINALYRDDIGFIDIVWGENDENNKGFGLKHIIEKHGDEFRKLNFTIENFIPIVISEGAIKKTNYKDRIYLYGKNFKAVISTKWNNRKKIFLLTAFELKAVKN